MGCQGFQIAIGFALRTNSSQSVAKVLDGSHPAGNSLPPLSLTRADMTLNTGLCHVSVTSEGTTAMYPCFQDFRGLVSTPSNQSKISVCAFCRQQCGVRFCTTKVHGAPLSKYFLK